MAPDGELMDNAFAFAEENATCTEDSYSYAVTKGTCKISNCTVDHPGKCHVIQRGARGQRAGFLIFSGTATRAHLP